MDTSSFANFVSQSYIGFRILISFTFSVENRTWFFISNESVHNLDSRLTIVPFVLPVVFIKSIKTLDLYPHFQIYFGLEFYSKLLQLSFILQVWISPNIVLSNFYFYFQSLFWIPIFISSFQFIYLIYFVFNKLKPSITLDLKSWSLHSFTKIM